MDGLEESGAKRLHDLIIRRTGMIPVYQPAIWRYPLREESGGVGETLAQPFVFAQPLAESLSFSLAGLCAVDTWEEHEGFFIVLASCRPINAASVFRFLKRKGWNVVDADFCKVQLSVPKKNWWRRLLCKPWG